MRIGLVGLGKMGAGMAERLLAAGHQVVGTDLSAEARADLTAAGGSGVATLDELVAALDPGPRVVWVMLPAGAVTSGVVAELARRLSSGDLVIDGGNSDFRDVERSVATLGAAGIRFADVGVSGGQWGRVNGYGLMVGASEDVVDEIAPILQALSGGEAARRVGDVGSGHFVKAVHNAVQYGVLQAYAEAFALLRAHPEVDVLASFASWQGGSSIRSWLLEQTLETLRANPNLDGVAGRVPDSGMGRWIAEEAIRLAVPTPVLTAGLQARFASRAPDDAARLLAASRGRVGGQPA